MSIEMCAAESIGMLAPGAVATGAPVAAAREPDPRPAAHRQPRGAVAHPWPAGPGEPPARTRQVEVARPRLRVSVPVYDRDGIGGRVIAVHEALARLGGLTLVFFRLDKGAMYLAYVDCDSASVRGRRARGGRRGRVPRRRAMRPVSPPKLVRRRSDAQRTGRPISGGMVGDWGATGGTPTVAPERATHSAGRSSTLTSPAA
jgi:hypothetical protein